MQKGVAVVVVVVVVVKVVVVLVVIKIIIVVVVIIITEVVALEKVANHIWGLAGNGRNAWLNTDLACSQLSNEHPFIRGHGPKVISRSMT
ncbi:hypothetical protein ElyMa_006340800 [Elysia marginata]|uniref:Uncharacterized protein n=1 Tax=Elysia marginata TaxID=1093978 RepID=A0AAV4HJK4_9GAST|nr:hypothetical protein ElyMa_006340800 [Elysia marginata]